MSRHYLFPDFSWEFAHKIQTTAYYFGVPLVIMFLKSAYPLDVSQRLSNIILMIGGSFATLVLFTPARIFNLVNPFYQIFSFLVIGYLLYIVSGTIYKKRENSWIIGLGLFILILFSINDIIFLSTWMADAEHSFLRKIITRGNLSSYGLLIFVFTQSMVLAKKFSKSFSTIELLSDQLKTTNVNLEVKIKERTLDLELSRAELHKAYQAATKSEKVLADFTQNISHDLRTPITAINGYVNGILDGIIKDTDQQKKYLLRIKERINQLSSMVQDLLDLSMLQTRQITFTFQQIPIEKYIQVISEKYSLDMASSKVHFEITHPFHHVTADHSDSTRSLPAATSSSLEISIDTENLERVFANLFSNSIKYSKGKPVIRLDFELTNNEQELLIKIADRGVGISPENLPYIFDRSYKVYGKQMVDGKTSNGLGLAIVNEIIAYHGGRIWVESEPGIGSCFFFTLPICAKRSHQTTNTKEV